MSEINNQDVDPSSDVQSADTESRADEDSITLQRLLKLMGLVASGGEAKVRIQAGEVRVNGEVETRRRKQLCSGDVIAFEEHEIVVDLEPEDETEGGDDAGD